MLTDDLDCRQEHTRRIDDNQPATVEDEDDDEDEYDRIPTYFPFESRANLP
jgi:hypothetical protein